MQKNCSQAEELFSTWEYRANLLVYSDLITSSSGCK